MRQRFNMQCGAVCVWIVGGWLLSGGLAAAQPATEDVEVEPLTCWWRTTAGSVRVGEPFTIVLTCSAIETASTRVVPDQSRLDASVLQLPPFEVLGGRRANDLRTVGQRFIQYEYSLRLLTEGAFGRDVPVPPVTVSYRIETRTGQGATSQGREQTYALPPLPIRIASLVPIESGDIREIGPSTLAEIDNRAFRARALRVGGLVLFALGGLVLVAGAVQAARGRRVAGPVTHTVGTAAILRSAGQSIAEVQREQRQQGWTPELSSKALAALRVVASIATGRAISQRALDRGEAVADGEVRVTRRFGGRSVAVSGSASAVSLARTSPGPHAALIDQVGEGLTRLTSARYGRDSVNTPDVDAALHGAARLAGRLAADHGWLAARRTELWRSLERLRPGAWA